jgi:hypothetical protein
MGSLDRYMRTWLEIMNGDFASLSLVFRELMGELGF